MTNRKLQYWVIPPKCDAEFVANMEDVLRVYEKPYDPAVPVVCMDEQPVQLIKETKIPIAATKSKPKRIDYEYERVGVANVFMFAEPLAGWRQVNVREHKTKIDWATEVAEILEHRYEECERVILVCDNLSTHTKGAFYEAFEPERAFRLAQKLEIHYTPKHGSWLNIAENELSSMTRQCISKRRLGSIDELREETTAWATDTSKQQRTVDWQMKVGDARCKLKSLYPKI